MNQSTSKNQNSRKKKFKYFIKLLPFLITLFIFTSSCDNELIIDINQSGKEFSYETVSLDEALELFKPDNNILKKSKSGLNLQADILSISQEKIKNTEEFVTLIPATTKHNNIETKIMLIKYNDSIIKVLINKIIDKNIESEKFSGIISITHLNGKFINGYRLKNGKFLSQFIRKEKQQNNSILYRSDPDVPGCDESLDPESTFCENLLDEVVLGSGNQSGSSNSTSLNIWVPSTTTNVGYYSTSIDGGGGPSNTSGSDGSGGEGLFPCNDPLHGCSNDYLNKCPEGEVRDKNYNCVKKPCTGNPVKTPIVAPQTNSGIKGGMYGKNRNLVNGIGTSWHRGIDIKNSYGSPIFAMHDGTAKLFTQKKEGEVSGAGHYVEITSIINDKNVKILYFHMQNKNRVFGEVKAGDIIGYQGDSGNLKAAIDQGLSESHLHIKAKLNGKAVDPNIYLATNFDTDTGVVLNQSNCN